MAKKKTKAKKRPVESKTHRHQDQSLEEEGAPDEDVEQVQDVEQEKGREEGRQEGRQEGDEAGAQEAQAKAHRPLEKS